MVQLGIIVILIFVLFGVWEQQPFATAKTVRHEYLKRVQDNFSPVQSSIMMQNNSQKAVNESRQGKISPVTMTSTHNSHYFHKGSSEIKKSLSMGRQNSESKPVLFTESKKLSNPIPVSQLVLKLNKDYTPKEIAEYIYSTGDEEGIAQTIWEMIIDGQIMESTDDVILFLEQVQMELGLMRGHDERT